MRTLRTSPQPLMSPKTLSIFIWARQREAAWRGASLLAAARRKQRACYTTRWHQHSLQHHTMPAAQSCIGHKTPAAGHRAMAQPQNCCRFQEGGGRGETASQAPGLSTWHPGPAESCGLPAELSFASLPLAGSSEPSSREQASPSEGDADTGGTPSHQAG